MAQLDRFLNILVSNNATALIMSEGNVATVMIKDSARPVMKQPLTSAQILTLVREIAPSNTPHALDAQGGVRFEYTSADGSFDVALTQNGKISARIERKLAPTNDAHPASNGALPNVEAPKVEAANMQIPQADAPASAGQTSALKAEATRVTSTGNRAFDRIETLLRVLVSKKASEISSIPNEPILTSEDIDAMLATIMLDHNREEFKELNDTDFAHEILGVARFRGNALRDRKGTGAVFRAIPAAVVTVEQMGLSQEVQRLCHLTKGLDPQDQGSRRRSAH